MSERTAPVRSYLLIRDMATGLWKITPADGPGGTVTATRVVINNLHLQTTSTGAFLIDPCELKVNEFHVLSSASDAVVDLATFYPPPRTVKVDNIKLFPGVGLGRK